MKIGNFNTKNKVFIVAEIGNNHEGNFEIAKKLIKEAADAGVDAVKFQTFIPEQFISSKDQLKLSRLKNFQLSFEQFEQLSKFAKKKGVIFFSTPLDIKSAKFLNNIQPVFKISSGDNNFYPLIETVAKFGKPLILSTGIANDNDINKVYDKISKIWSKKKKNLINLAFLHCVSSYPAPSDQANLASILHMKKLFPKVVIGYSDHTYGINVPVLSVAAGARIVEKHFTLDKNFSDFRDHKLSADPKEMHLMVNKIREIEKIIGKEEKKMQLCEKNMKKYGRRSLAAAHNLLKGNKLKKSDLIWVRPGEGFSPGNEKKILGKKLCKDLQMGEIIKKKDLK